MFTAPSRYFHQEHEIFREQVRSFVDKEIEPYIDQWEEGTAVSQIGVSAHG